MICVFVIARSRLPLRRRQWRLRAREHTSVSTAALGHEFQKGAGRAHASASRLREGILDYDDVFLRHSLLCRRTGGSIERTAGDPLHYPPGSLRGSQPGLDGTFLSTRAVYLL